MVAMLAVIGAAALFWGRRFIGHADGEASKKGLVASKTGELTGTTNAGESTVELT
jgi:hypothetical protein